MTDARKQSIFTGKPFEPTGGVSIGKPFEPHELSPITSINIEKLDEMGKQQWRMNASAVALRVATHFDTFTTDDIWRALHGAGYAFGDQQTLNGVLRQLQNRGSIRPTGDKTPSALPETLGKSLTIYTATATDHEPPRLETMTDETESETEALTASEAAKRLGVATKTIRRRISLDHYPNAFKDPTGAWRIPLEDLTDEIAQAEAKPKPVETAEAGTVLALREAVAAMQNLAHEVQVTAAEAAKEKATANFLREQLAEKNAKIAELEAAQAEARKTPEAKRRWWRAG